MLDTLKHISKMPIKSDILSSGRLSNLQLVGLWRNGFILNWIGGFNALHV